MKLGLIKGGQLGKMLLEASSGFPITTKVMDPSASAPCRKICDVFVQDDPEKYEAVRAFGKDLDVLTFEYEHVNTQALEALENEGIKVFPRPQTMKIIQDKGAQKLFYRVIGAPTPDFVLLGSPAEVQGHPDYLPGVLKARTHGYDGKGVMRIDKASDAFLAAFQGPCVLEKRVDFLKEISILVARSSSGEKALYPAVEIRSNPERNLLDILFSPADVSPRVMKSAEEIALEVAERLNMVGVLAVEMFVTRDERVLVNEAAPRPHNTGHHTIEANQTSQYEQHLRAVLGSRLGPVAAKAPAAMVNLVGAEGYAGSPLFEGLDRLKGKKGVYVHLYGKVETRPFRKMGHVTLLGRTIEEAKENAEWVKKNVRVIA